jgi:hypothetical protein
MTEEVDPRLVALGLVPAPPGWKEQWASSESALPAQESPASFAPAPVAAPPAPAEPNPFATGTDLFPGMGKFTGMPADTPAAPPPTYVPEEPPPPVYNPPAYTPPAFTPTYTAPPVAPPAPETPLREAPPPLPPLAASMPTATAAVEAPAIPAKKEKPGKAKKEKKERVARAPQVEKAAKAKPIKPRFVLPPSGVLLRGPIVMGYPEKKLQITLEQLGFRIDAKESIEVAWTDVREIKARRGRIMIRTKGRPVAFGIPVEGVAEPTLAGPLARVVKEASGGNLDLAGSAFLELQNATDSLRDHYHDEDDPLIPTVVGLVFVLAGLTVTALLPDAIAIATRTPVAPGGYLLDSPPATIDPRVLVASFAAAAMLAGGVVRIAMGKAATAWARGTLRGWGWHEGSRRPVELLRRALGAIVLNPAIAAALLLLAIVLALPSARVQTVIDAGGFHVMREVPFFDEDRPWSTVTDISTVPAPTAQHFEGIAVVFAFQNKSPISTLDLHLRGGTDKQLLTDAEAWREGRSSP